MEIEQARNRVLLANVSPQVDCGRFAIKRIVGDEVVVEVDAFCDGHDHIACMLLCKKEGDGGWQELMMHPIGNDRYQQTFTCHEPGTYYYTIHAWVDHFATWQDDMQKKRQAGIDYAQDFDAGLKLIQACLHDDALKAKYQPLIDAKDFSLTEDSALASALQNRQWVTSYPITLSCIVEPRIAQFSAWYELFPRSLGPDQKTHGTFKDLVGWLGDISDMGFDVLYLPPIHPIGHSFRKGKNNHLQASSSDHGSPWAIGSTDGGHKSLHPLLGTFEDFEVLVKKAKEHNIQIALDLAFQCSPDHPYLKEHPEWFLHRPDGTIKHAENPPKKYEDIVPFNFETDSYKELWEELASIVFFWIDKGIRIFRVDNPHTKPFLFWQWLIRKVKQKHPETIFLSEAFTRPKLMHYLAKAGFSQSYTYFTWRYTKNEMTRFIQELTQPEVVEYFRPNLWTNTPDILPIDLQYDSKAAFMIRLILAATLSSSYGVYGPPFERLYNIARGESEEYQDAEKYELAAWDKEEELPLKELMKTLNQIRRQNPALQKTANIKFCDCSNNQLLYFAKFASYSLLVVVSTNPYEKQTATIKIPLDELGISPQEAYRVHELLQGRRLLWEGESIQVCIDPSIMPAAIYKLQTPMRREKGFEYFM